MEQPPKDQSGATDSDRAEGNRANIFTRIRKRVLWVLVAIDNHDGIVNAIGTIVIAIFTVVLAFATIQLERLSEKQAVDTMDSVDISRASSVAAQQAANFSGKQAEALITSQRPWLSPGEIELDEPAKMGETLKLKITFQNTGREPAKDINQRHAQEIVTGVIVAENSFDFPVTTKNMRDGLVPSTEGRVAFPGSVYKDRIPPLDALVTERVFNKTAIIIARGFAYTAQNKRGYSSYCYKFDGSNGRAIAEWEWIPCRGFLAE